MRVLRSLMRDVALVSATSALIGGVTSAGGFKRSEGRNAPQLMRVRTEASNTAVGFTPPDLLLASGALVVPGMTTRGRAASISAETAGTPTVGTVVTDAVTGGKAL